MSVATSLGKLQTRTSLHRLGVLCGLAAGAWLGAAEAPTKLVTIGLSPFVISLGMVLGVFTARWTLPVVVKGTGYVWRDLRDKPHLIVWALLAGMLWAVANTLTIFAIRNIGLSIAFPLWNTNSLVGLFWGWLLFGELRGGGRRNGAKVVGGTAAIVLGAALLALATSYQQRPEGYGALAGIVAALGAGLLWGTMYIPYRKAYISGMNPLSFVTVFTFGELAAMVVISWAFAGGWDGLASQLAAARPVLFWLFLGGLCWVIGDLFQQYAAKYVGIGRGIPLSNTNQLWGLAWGALVFGEMAQLTQTGQMLVVAGSLLMVLGAIAISQAEAPTGELEAWQRARKRESLRYGLELARLEAAAHGQDTVVDPGQRSLWDYVVAALATLLLVWLASEVRATSLELYWPWLVVLLAASVGILVFCGLLLWQRTRFC